MHALSARPLRKVWRGRESNMYADGMEYIFFAFSVGYAWTLSCRGAALPCLGDADRVCFANRSIPRWRRPANEAFINNLYQNKITFCCHHAVKAETADELQPLVYSSAEIDGRMRIGAYGDE